VCQYIGHSRHSKLSFLVANSIHIADTDKTRQDETVLSCPCPCRLCEIGISYISIVGGAEKAGVENAGVEHNLQLGAISMESRQNSKIPGVYAKTKRSQTVFERCS